MKIAMIGSGAAGSVLAGYMRLGGAGLTLVDPYKEHMDKIAADGLTFVINGGETHQLTGFKTAYSADDIGIMDIVIFMTKTNQLDEALKGAAPCIGPETVLVSLMLGRAPVYEYGRSGGILLDDESTKAAVRKIIEGGEQ